jgi:hypothetical protein
MARTTYGTTTAAARLNYSSDDPDSDVRVGNVEVAAGPVIANTNTAAWRLPPRNEIPAPTTKLAPTP